MSNATHSLGLDVMDGYKGASRGLMGRTTCTAFNLLLNQPGQ